METIGIGLYVMGVILSIVGGVWLLVVAFTESPLWGVGCLCVPFVSIVFAVTHWDRAGKPFLVQLAALVPLLAGGFLMGDPGKP